jgi:hypothetical protein
MNGIVTGSMVTIFDHDQRCHITGSGDGVQHFLYHHGEKLFVNLTVQGNDFSGHDYGHSTRFSGTVEDNSVSLYEHVTCRQFSYSLVLSLDPPWLASER